jgi:hypothetical protein
LAKLLRNGCEKTKDIAKYALVSLVSMFHETALNRFVKTLIMEGREGGSHLINVKMLTLSKV